MREAVENGGKRIRPILLFESCKCLPEAGNESGWKEEAAPFLAALEMIHSFHWCTTTFPAWTMIS